MNWWPWQVKQVPTQTSAGTGEVIGVTPRELIRLNDGDWERLPQGIVGRPVYYREVSSKYIEVWPPTNKPLRIWV